MITRRTAAPPAAPAFQAPPPPPQQQYAQPASGLAPAAAEGPNFMDLGFYNAGFLIPQGRYVITDATVMLFKGEKSTQPQRLGAMITFVPLSDPRPESAKTQFYSFGSDADKSYMPNPAHGKGIVPIPGAPQASFAGSTNWWVFLKSLHDCGMPKGYATNRVDPIEGCWVHIVHIDEPEERKAFQSKTAEVQTQSQGPKKIAVVCEILEGGAVWEGKGGWPNGPVQFTDTGAAASTIAAHAQATPTPTQAPAPTYQPPAAPPPPPPVNGGMDAADIRVHAQNAIADILEAVAVRGEKTVLRLAMRNNAFTNIAAKYGEPVAAAVLGKVFDAPGQLESVLGDLGYVVNGASIQAR